MRTNLDDNERLPAIEAESAPETVGGEIGGLGISGIAGWGLLTAPLAPAASKRLLLIGIDNGRDDDDNEGRLVSVEIVKLSLVSSVTFT